MDPISGLVAAVVAVALINRLPGLVVDLVHAARGEESPTRAARAKRLAEAGVEPGRGGAARQYMAGVWRDAWLDAEKARVAKRDQRRAEAAANPGGPSRWQQRRAEWADRAATAAAAVTDRWRGAEPLDPTGHVHGTSPTTSTGTGAATGATSTAGAYATDAPLTPPPSPGSDAQTDRSPTRVTATLGPPTPAGQHTAPPSPAPQSTTRSKGATTMSTAVATGSVTGAASAAAAARALRDAMNDATAAYTAELYRIRSGLQRLHEAAISDVQLRQNAGPVQRLVEAAGHLNNLGGHVNNSATAVSGWLGATASAFDTVAS